jgi:hypothetical protein
MKKSYFTSRRDTRYAEEERPVSRYSYGLNIPKSGAFQACLCADKDNLTYSKKCCKGYLFNQGVGQTMSPYPSSSI